MDQKPPLTPQREFVAPAMPKILEGKYQFLEHLGSGKYSTVYKTKDLVKDEIVAVKKIHYKMNAHGIPGVVIREISILKELNHDNIVRLLDVYPTVEETYLVFEYMDCDLRRLFRTIIPGERDPQLIKNLMFQILSGVAFCHSLKIYHRDLKPDNILVDVRNLRVKIIDFGISREVSTPRKAYTPKVGTARYMAPEMLFKFGKYSYPVDIWSVGCIFAEMVTRRILFPRYEPNEEMYSILPRNPPNDQIQSIFSVMGTPNEETWPGITKIFPDIVMLKKRSLTKLEDEIHFQGLEPDGVNLLSEMLHLDPRKRITARDALKHPYFIVFKS